MDHCLSSENQYLYKILRQMSANTPSTSEISPPWSQYPIGLRNDLCSGYDLIAYRNSLEAKAEQIFIQDEAKIKVEVNHFSEGL
jgi:hypothetical protein